MFIKTFSLLTLIMPTILKAKPYSDGSKVFVSIVSGDNIARAKSQAEYFDSLHAAIDKYAKGADEHLTPLKPFNSNYKPYNTFQLPDVRNPNSMQFSLHSPQPTYAHNMRAMDLNYRILPPIYMSNGLGSIPNIYNPHHLEQLRSTNDIFHGNKLISVESSNCRCANELSKSQFNTESNENKAKSSFKTKEFDQSISTPHSSIKEAKRNKTLSQLTPMSRGGNLENVRSKSITVVNSAKMKPSSIEKTTSSTLLINRKQPQGRKSPKNLMAKTISKDSSIQKSKSLNTFYILDSLKKQNTPTLRAATTTTTTSDEIDGNTSTTDTSSTTDVTSSENPLNSSTDDKSTTSMDTISTDSNNSMSSSVTSLTDSTTSTPESSNSTTETSSSPTMSSSVTSLTDSTTSTPESSNSTTETSSSPTTLRSTQSSTYYTKKMTNTTPASYYSSKGNKKYSYTTSSPTTLRSTQSSTYYTKKMTNTTPASYYSAKDNKKYSNTSSSPTTLRTTQSSTYYTKKVTNTTPASYYSAKDNKKYSNSRYKVKSHDSYKYVETNEEENLKMDKTKAYIKPTDCLCSTGSNHMNVLQLPQNKETYSAKYPEIKLQPPASSVYWHRIEERPHCQSYEVVDRPIWQIIPSKEYDHDDDNQRLEIFSEEEEDKEEDYENLYESNEKHYFT